MEKFITAVIEPFQYKLNMICGEIDFIKDTLLKNYNGDFPEEFSDIVSSKMATCDAVTFTDTGGGGCVFYIVSPDSIAPDVVAHEAYHILNMLFEQIGYAHNLDNDELEAYVFQSIFSKINSFYNED